MTNHIHSILEPGDDPKSISALTKRINGHQLAYVNKLEGHSASLSEGRCKASPIQRDAYLLSCLRYVELNPVKANMVAGPKQYRWSSYSERMSTGEATMSDLDVLLPTLRKKHGRSAGAIQIICRTRCSYFGTEVSG